MSEDLTKVRFAVSTTVSWTSGGLRESRVKFFSWFGTHSLSYYETELPHARECLKDGMILEWACKRCKGRGHVFSECRLCVGFGTKF